MVKCRHLLFVITLFRHLLSRLRQGKSVSKDAPFSFPGRGSIGFAQAPNGAWFGFAAQSVRPLARRRQASEFSPKANTQRNAEHFNSVAEFDRRIDWVE